MRIKRILLSCAVCLMAVSMLVVSASAHGGHHGGGGCRGQRTQVQQTVISVCPVEGCTLSGRHVHNNVTYCGSNHACGFCDGSCSVYYFQSCHH